MEPSGTTRHTCLKLEISPVAGAGAGDAKEFVFVKGTWSDTHFHLSITDGLRAWTCTATESEVRLRAEQWDQPVAEYVALAERYLGFQQPGSRYGFEDAGNDQKRLSWTFEKQGTKLEWRWKCQPSSHNKQTTAGILDFLMDSNIRLSEEVVRKTQAFEKAKIEAERCLSQSEKFNNEKTEFESAVYAKVEKSSQDAESSIGKLDMFLVESCGACKDPFLAKLRCYLFVDVLNSKKAKLRELRDQISKLEAGGKAPQQEESTDRTESFDEESDHERVEDIAENLPSSSKDVAPSSSKRRAGRGRK